MPPIFARRLIADGITGYDKVPMKGQAQMPAEGAGGDSTVDMSLRMGTRGPNILGVTSKMSDAWHHKSGHPARRLWRYRHLLFHRPETAFGSCTGGQISNNSGDTVGYALCLAPR